VRAPNLPYGARRHSTADRELVQLGGQHSAARGVLREGVPLLQGVSLRRGQLRGVEPPAAEQAKEAAGWTFCLRSGQLHGAHG